MKKIWKKNQVIITALAIMIAVAGYLNFTSDKQVLNTSVENMESEGAEGNSDDSTVSAAVEDTVTPDEYASAEGSDDMVETMETVDGQAADPNEINSEADDETTGLEDYDMAEASLDENGDPIDGDSVGEAVLTSGQITLSQAKLTREQTRSKAKEMLLEIINNDSLTEDAKKDAIAKMLSMTERMEKETAAENQLAAKGFTDSVVSISDDSVDVSVPFTTLSDKQRTQIEDVVTRKTGYELNQIVITTMQAE